MARTTPAPLPGAASRNAARARQSLGDAALQSLGALTFILMLATLYLALIYAPTEAVQGHAQRIFYFHVPTAWVGFLAFFVVFVASISYLLRGGRTTDAIARSSAEIGLLFTTMMLVTGSLWGKPIWGTWWTWDPKLTTSLILWFIYVGYLMLRAYAPTREQSARYGAVLGIVGFVDVPIVYMATTWWRTQHPEAVITADGASMAPEMLLAFLVSLLSFTLLFLYLLIQRVHIQRLQDKADDARLELAAREVQRGGIQ